MNELIMQLIKLQGEMNVRAIQAGLPVDKAAELSNELLDHIARSEVVSADHRAAYLDFQATLA